jgi:HEPN domain-containing protein
MDKDTQNWHDIAMYDIGSAEAMLKAGRYIYVMFMCQQAVEKMLKAVIAQESGTMPPKTHDLERLAIAGTVTLDGSQLEFIRMLTEYYIETRYPEDIATLNRDLDKSKAAFYLKETEAFLEWLKLKLK